MKRYQKVVLSTVIASTLTLSNISLNVNQVYANEQISNIENVEIIGDETYIIDDNGTLYTNNEVYQFNKVLENVKQVYPTGEYETVFILKNDGTLVLGKEIRKTYTDENTGKLKLDNSWEFYNVEKNVKNVAVDYYGENAYVLKNDGTIIMINELEYYLSGLIDGENSSENKTKLKYKAKDIIVDYNDDVYIVDQNNTLYNLGDISYYYEDVSIDKADKIMDNVADIVTNDRGVVFLTTDGQVYVQASGYFYGNAYINKDVAEFFGTTPESASFSKFILVADDTKAVQQGSESTFIIKNDNSLWTFGDNSYGELGLPNVEEYATEFTKISDNVVDVASSNNCTVYVTTDGKLMATGDIEYAQITNSDVEREVLYDDEGLYKITQDITDMSLTYNFSIYTKEDGSLWAIGESGLNEIYGYAETKIVDDVDFANAMGNNIVYITGENKELYAITGLGDSADYYYYSYEYEDEMAEYMLGLLGLEDIFTVDEVLSEDFDESLLDEYLDAYSEEELDKLSEQLDNYFYELTGEVTNSLIASNVIYSDGLFYLTDTNELYGVIGEEITKIADNVHSFSADNEFLYIVDKDGNLKYATLKYLNDEYILDTTELVFYDTGISNVKSVKGDDDTYEYSVYVLDSKNNLKQYEIEHEEMAEVESDVDSVELFMDADVYEIGENVIGFEPTADSCYFLLADGTLNEIDVFYGDREVKKITDNVKAIDAGIYNSDLLILKNDGTLYSRGYNSYGELGFNPELEEGSSDYIFTPFEVSIILK